MSICSRARGAGFNFNTYDTELSKFSVSQKDKASCPSQSEPNVQDL